MGDAEEEVRFSVEGAYLVGSRAYKCIVSEVPANVGGDDFAVDTVARDEVFVLARSRGLRGLSWPVARSCRHSSDCGKGRSGPINKTMRTIVDLKKTSNRNVVLDKRDGDGVRKRMLQVEDR